MGDSALSRSRRRSCAPMPGEAMTKRIATLLKYGDTRGHYGGDPFRTCCAIIWECARIEMNPVQMLHHLANPDNEGARAFWDKGSTSRYLDQRKALRLYEKALRDYAAAWADATDTRIAIGEAVELVAVSTLPDDRSGSRRKVLLAHLRAAQAAACTRYGASVRRIADDAQVSANTVRAAQEKLEQLGLLYRDKAGNSRRCTQWHIPVRRIAAILDTVGTRQGFTGTTGSSLAVAVVNHEGWRYGSGLSHATWSILATSESATVKELHARSGRPIRTIRTHLSKLEQAGLAVRFDDGTWRAVEPREQLDAHAIATGMDERKRKQHERHVVDRQRHRERLKERREQAAADAWSGYCINPHTGEVLEFRQVRQSVTTATVDFEQVAG